MKISLSELKKTNSQWKKASHHSKRSPKSKRSQACPRRKKMTMRTISMMTSKMRKLSPQLTSSKLYRPQYPPSKHLNHLSLRLFSKNPQVAGPPLPMMISRTTGITTMKKRKKRKRKPQNPK